MEEQRSCAGGRARNLRFRIQYVDTVETPEGRREIPIPAEYDDTPIDWSKIAPLPDGTTRIQVQYPKGRISMNQDTERTSAVLEPQMEQDTASSRCPIGRSLATVQQAADHLSVITYRYRSAVEREKELSEQLREFSARAQRGDIAAAQEITATAVRQREAIEQVETMRDELAAATREVELVQVRENRRTFENAIAEGLAAKQETIKLVREAALALGRYWKAVADASKVVNDCGHAGGGAAPFDANRLTQLHESLQAAIFADWPNVESVKGQGWDQVIKITAMRPQSEERL